LNRLFTLPALALRAGATLRGIAAALNERAFVTRRGSTWLLESEGLFFSVGTGNAKAGAKA